VGTRRAWKRCESIGLQARGIVVTGLDKDNTDFDKTVSEIQAVWGNKCVPVVIPLPDGAGVLDVLAAKEVPDAVSAKVEEIKSGLVELAAESDDTLIEKFLEGESLTPEEISKGLVAAVATGGLVPIFVCMALKDVGVTDLLENIYRLFPSPDSVVVKDAEGNPIDTSPDAPMAAFVWRTVNDPFVGQLTFVRVLGGTLKSDGEIWNATQNHKEKIGSLLKLNGKKQETVTEAEAGDIVAIPKLKDTHVSDTLCDASNKIVCKKIEFPSPVVFQAVHAKTQADEDKIGTALTRVCEEDPTLHVVRNTETRETVLQGLGDVHIDVAVGLMHRRSHVDVTLTTPKVPYRETATAMGEGHYKHKKQSGGRGQFGEV
jgi:elongation factor G